VDSPFPLHTRPLGRVVNTCISRAVSGKDVVTRTYLLDARGKTCLRRLLEAMIEKGASDLEFEVHTETATPGAHESGKLSILSGYHHGGDSVLPNWVESPLQNVERTQLPLIIDSLPYFFWGTLFATNVYWRDGGRVLGGEIWHDVRLEFTRDRSVLIIDDEGLANAWKSLKAV
jgi:hypothetical protein